MRKLLPDTVCPVLGQYVYSGTISYEYGLELGLQLAASSERPSAIFATADILAFGLIKGLKRGGLKVTEDISVVGFDDGFLAGNMEPALTYRSSGCGWEGSNCRPTGYRRD